MSRILVTYFSASGETREVAKVIAEESNADLFEIEPEIPYTSQDLSWMDKKSRSSLEMNDSSCRPVIKSHIDNFEDYDMIFIGFPIWWYVQPRIIDTFLESYDFTGKTIVPFATSGGSGINRAEDSMKKLCPNASYKKGQVLRSRDVKNWIKNIL